LGGVTAAVLACSAGCAVETSADVAWAAGGGFSWRVNALSDLGVSRAASVFNGSLKLAGALSLAFALGFLKAYGRDRLLKLSGILLAVGGASLAMVGVFTLEQPRLHLTAALGYFILYPVAMMLAGFAWRKAGAVKAASFSAAAGAAALLTILAGLYLEFFTEAAVGFAVAEMLEAALIGAWTAWAGVKLINAPSK